MKRVLSRGLFIGRFQPFHLGHKASIDFALSQVESLVIVIGSSQKSYEARNPFTSGERILMIKESLNADVDLDQKRLFIIPIPDINIHSLWTAQISNSVPKFESVFTNDEFTNMLFKEKGVKVIGPPLHRRHELSGTAIRNRIANDLEWLNLVSPQTAVIIEDIAGVQRIKKLSLLDRHSDG